MTLAVYHAPLLALKMYKLKDLACGKSREK
jgi:hypothetical protein